MANRRLLDVNSALYIWQKVKQLVTDRLEGKADRTELHSHENKVELDKILTGEVEQWRNMAATGVPEFPNQSTLDALGTNTEGKLTLNGVVVDTDTVQDLAGYALKEDHYTKTEVDSKLSSAMRYKGTVQSYDLLPTNAEVGDTYNITEGSEHNLAGDNAVWNGEAWDLLSGVIDVSLFLTEDDIADNAEIEAILQ